MDAVILDGRAYRFSFHYSEYTYGDEIWKSSGGSIEPVENVQFAIHHGRGPLRLCVDFKFGEFKKRQFVKYADAADLKAHPERVDNLLAQLREEAKNKMLEEL